MFCEISYFITCLSNSSRDSPAIKSHKYQFSTFVPVFWPSMRVNKGQRTSGRRSRCSYNYNGSIWVPEYPLKGNPHEFQGPCSSAHSTAAGSAASWKTEMVAFIRGRDGQNQQKLLSSLSCPGLVQKLGLVCEVCLGPDTSLPPGASTRSLVLPSTNAGTNITFMIYSLSTTLAAPQPCFPNKM